MNLNDNILHQPNQLPAPPVQAPPLGLDLSLSGGGIRATLYHLGVFVHLANTGRLPNVKTIVSVSGGSITSAHFGKYWRRAVESHEGFIEVASTLVRFTRTNVRDTVLVPWIRSRLFFRWRNRKLSRTARLEAAYQKHFGETTLGDIQGPDFPQLAIVATDPIQNERVAFTQSDIIQFRIDDPDRAPTHIDGTGARLSVAVAASSCFPLVFPALTLNANDLGLVFREARETMLLKDGGLAGNIGVNILLEMRRLQNNPERATLVSSAERPLIRRPSDTMYNDANVNFGALSADEIARAREVLGQNFVCTQFAERNRNPFGLQHLTETALFQYRTDLDSPTWQEAHALLLHGAASAQREYGETAEDMSRVNQQTIRSILSKAGCAQALAIPTSADISSCGTCPKAHVIRTLILTIFTFIVGLLIFISLALRWWYYHPPYPLNDIHAHIAMIKRTTLDHTEEPYKREMEGKIVTWPAKVDYIDMDGKKGRLSVLHEGAKYDLFVKFANPSVILAINQTVTVSGRVTESTSSGTYLEEVVVVK
ncbi:MAG TPA: patatin-like phospholipase family protein [Gemmatales bacterium]|nr:patatin-like phospholipase family protein [Gemmatales bacterium]